MPDPTPSSPEPTLVPPRLRLPAWLTAERVFWALSLQVAFALGAALVLVGDGGSIELRSPVVIHRPQPPAPPVPPVPIPPPSPGPGPPPPAPPAPLAGTLHVSLVTDLAAITPDVAVLREGVKVRDAFRGLDAIYRTYMNSSPDLARFHLAEQVNRVGLPTLIVQGPDGHVIAAEKAPATEDALIARIKTLREGGK